MSSRPIRIALLAPYPAQDVLPEGDLKNRFRNREHPAPWIRNLCAELSRRTDLEVAVISDSRAVRRRIVCRKDNIEYVFQRKIEPARLDPYHGYLPSLMRFRRSLAAFMPDVVQGFGTENCYGLAAALSGYPSVVFIQGIRSKMAGFTDFTALQMAIWRRLERVAVSRAGGIIAETNFAASWAREIKHKARVEIVPHALDRDFLNVMPDFSHREILCIGTLSRTKGTDLVLEMFARADHASSRLVFIGDGERRDLFEAQAARLGISQAVEFCGRLTKTQIAGRMASARLMVIGSRMDTSPNVITEAHASGLPVVGSDAGGIPEMIEDGKDGYVVALGDLSAMAHRVNNLLDHPETCRLMGMRGREKVKKLNDPGRITDIHIQLYRELARR